MLAKNELRDIKGGGYITYPSGGGGGIGVTPPPSTGGGGKACRPSGQFPVGQSGYASSGGGCLPPAYKCSLC